MISAGRGAARNLHGRRRSGLSKQAAPRVRANVQKEELTGALLDFLLRLFDLSVWLFLDARDFVMRISRC
jgi:hypothetical protein